MKKYFVMAMAMMMVATMAMAQGLSEDETESTWSASVSASAVSRYVGSSGTRLTDGPVAQTESTISHESGLSLTFWTSKGLKSGDGISDEVDFILGYEKEIGGALFSFSAGYYDFVRATDGNVWCLSAGMSREYKFEGSSDSLTPALRFEKVIPAGSDCPYSSAFLVEVSTEARLGLKDFDLYLTPALVFDEGEYGGLRHFMWRWELGAEFEVGGVTISPSITWFRPSEIGVSEEDMLELEKNMVVGLKLTKEF